MVFLFHQHNNTASIVTMSAKLIATTKFAASAPTDTQRDLPRLRIGVFATDDTIDAIGHVHGGVLYMANLVSVLTSFERVDIILLSQSCLKQKSAKHETVAHRRALFELPNVTRVDLDDASFDFVRNMHNAPQFNGSLCSRAYNYSHYDEFHARVLPSFFESLNLDVLLVRSQRLRWINASTTAPPQVLMPKVMRLFQAQPPGPHIPHGRAWIVYMNSFLEKNLTVQTQLANWVKRRGHRLLFQEHSQVRFAEQKLSFLDNLPSKLIWIPPMAPASALRAKVHPRGARPLTLCYVGNVNGNRYLSNDMVLGFAEARKRLPAGQLRMILVENRPAGRTMRLTPELRRDIEYRGSAIPHAEALELYRNSCDLGVRGSQESHAGGVATKVIEMAAFGIPSIVNPMPTNAELYGDAYPYFWSYSNSTAALAEILVRAATNADEYDNAARIAVQAVMPYTFESLRTRIAPWIET
jgi:glycosyltransferase involved in cell wall biosynthesis